jgi:hypothetical protein
MLIEIVAPFDAELENEKGDAEYPGCGAALDEPAAIPGFDEGDTRAEDETASQQDHGVDHSNREIGLSRGRIEPSLVPVAGIDPGQEKRAEEQHLGRQKQPHPGDGRLRLMACA